MFVSFRKGLDSDTSLTSLFTTPVGSMIWHDLSTHIILNEDMTYQLISYQTKIWLINSYHVKQRYDLSTHIKRRYDLTTHIISNIDMTYQLFNFVYQIFGHITWDIYIRHQYHLGSAFAFALILPLPYGSICSNPLTEILGSLGMEHGLFVCCSAAISSNSSQGNGPWTSTHRPIHHLVVVQT